MILKRLYPLFLSLFCLFLPVALHAESAPNIIQKITINGEIEHGVVAYVERALKTAQNDGATALIVEINTPGGRVDSALAIKDSLLSAQTPTIAFINHNALSAGALIALSMDKIYMTEGSTIGAATPVTGDSEKASEKMVSALRSAFASTAEATDRDPEIARAMVDEDIEIKDIVEKGKLLTLTAKEAQKLGLTNGITTTIDAALANAGIENISEKDIQFIPISASENFVRFITSGMVASILLTLGFLGMLLEFKAPGWGLAGLISVIAYGLFFWGHHLAGLAGWEDILLMILGVLLILLELFIIPGTGLAGLLGFVSLIAGLAMAMVGSEQGWSSQALIDAATMVSATFVVGLILSLTILKLIFKRAVFNSGFVLKDSYIDQEKEQIKEKLEKNPLEIKQKGMAVTDLRPAGTALFEDEKFSVVTEGSFIEKGTKLKIIDIEGVRIVVREEN